MDWVVSAVGAGLVMAALRDLFHTLWHPTGRGGLSTLVMTGLWRLSRRFGPRGRVAAVTGPLAMVAAVGMWASILIMGWTLVYWPHMPDGFVFAPGLGPAQRTDLLDGLYLSLVTVTTLGFGDIVPADGWLRVAAPLQALMGFALLTAAVSWVVQIYPALTRRRVLAIKLASLRGAGGAVLRLDSAAGLLASLAAEVVHVRVGLTQHAETYYFHDGEDRSSLAAMVGYAADLSVRGQMSPRSDVRLTAALLAHALEDFAATLDERFLHVEGTPLEVFSAYATDHGRSLARA
jgi:hypothetical protein